MREQAGFNIERLAAELRDIFAELCVACEEQAAYRYIVNYIILRISEDTGRKTEFRLPEIGSAGSVLEKLHSTLARSRYDFSIAAEKGLLGEIYENFLSRDTRKRLGLFYTPDSVIGFILENTVGRADVVENPYIKVLDPSCGSGYFLLKAYDILRKKFEDSGEALVNKYGDAFRNLDIHCHIIRNCIYGADIDEFGAAFTSTALAFKGEGASWCRPNVVVCDSLVKWEKETAGEMASFWSTGFDCIVGNPPWVSLTRKQAKQLPEDRLAYYRSNYSGNSYLPNLYEYFLQRSLELVRDGGSVGFLIPDRFAKNKQFVGYRRKILSEYNLRALMFGISMEGVIADSMVMVIENSFSHGNLTEVRSKAGMFRNPQKLMLVGENCTFPSYSIEDCRLLLEDMHRNSVPLKQIARSFTGFIGIKKNMTEHKTDSRQVPFVKGEDVARYRTKGSRYYDISPQNIIGGTRNAGRLKAKDKILVRKTGNRIVAAIDSCGYAPEQSLYGIIVKSPDFTAKYVLAILNSRLMEEYYVKFLVTNVNSTPQLKKMDLDSIPIKNCPMEKQRQIGKIVDRLAAEYRQELQDELDRMICEIYVSAADMPGN
ncbi:MAG: putative methyltransferase [Firmicutes bacterium]|nr:putative methyltransferase [Bacillota bacterium]